jgi:WD40 repeat protein
VGVAGEKPAKDSDLPPFAIKRFGSLKWQFASFVTGAAYSLDGKKLLISEWTHTYVFDPQSGKLLNKYPGRASFLAPGQNGPIAIGNGSPIEMWDAFTGKERRAFPGVLVSSVTASLDGKLLAGIGSMQPDDGKDDKGDGKRAYHGFVWNTTTGKPLPAYADGIKDAKSIAVAPDGKGLAWRTISELHVVNLNLDLTDRFRLKVPVIERNIVPTDPHVVSPSYALAISPDSKVIAMGTRDGLLIVDAATGKKETKCIRKQPFYKTENIHTIAFTPAGDKVIAIDQISPLAVFDVASGKEVASFHAPGALFAVSPDGKSLVFSGDQTIHFYDLATGKPKTEAGRHGMIMRGALSPDGKTAATASTDWHIRLWDCATGEVRHPIKHEPGAYPDSMVFTPDSTTLIGNNGASIGALSFWDVRTGKQVDRKLEGATYCRCLAMSSDGATLAGGADNGVVHLWDLKTGKHARFEISGKGMIESIGFSRDGKRLVATSGTYHTLKEFINDNAIYVLDVPNQKELRRIGITVQETNTHNPALRAAITPDGKLLVTLSSASGFLGIRDADTGQKVPDSFTWDRGGTTATLAISPDGLTLAVATGGYHPSPDTFARIHLFDLKSMKSLQVLDGHRRRISSLSFAADSQTLFSASHDGTGLLWDLRKVRR